MNTGKIARNIKIISDRSAFRSVERFMKSAMRVSGYESPMEIRHVKRDKLKIFFFKF